MRTPLQRRVLPYLFATLVVALIVVVYRLLGHVNPTTASLILLLGVLLVSAAWDLWVAVYASVLAALAFNYYFLPPVRTLTIADPENWVALAAFLLTAVIASRLADKARKQTVDANTRRIEVERLYAFSQQLLVSGNVTELLSAIPALIVRTFAIEAAAIYVASRNEIHFSGERARAMTLELLHSVMLREEVVVDQERRSILSPVRLGVRSVGSLGIQGPFPPLRTIDALASLVAIAIERARTVEDLTKAEASRESERLRTVLLDSVTHEFLTPLTAIKASVTGLMGGQTFSQTQRQELLTVIDEEADRLNHLVEDVAKMAQLDAGEMELTMRPHPIREAIDAAVEQSKRSLSRHPLEVRIPLDLPQALYDPLWIKEVLVHLLENAAKYSEAETPITLSVEAHNGKLTVSVADRGGGIDEIERALIFDKFYRGKDQRYRVQGTGMGLAISKAIVDAHKGAIGLTSQPGLGSVFHFTLPLYQGDRNGEQTSRNPDRG